MLATTLTALAMFSAATAQMTIQVGAEATTSGGIFQYIPNSLNATNGTVITFEFSGAPGNHSVTQSSFADPCTPLAGGFDSGWILLSDAPSTPPLWNLTITDDSKPIWFFCKQLLPMPHCSAGMVGAINAPASGANTFANFQAAALKFQGDSGQSVGGLVGIGASASAGIGPVPTDATVFGEPSGATLAASAASSPTATSPSTATGTSTSTSASGSPTTTTSSASKAGAGFISVVIAAIAGISLV
ncbi:hypothetical protein HYPSUDRAFT_47543 [Hypholoma sublateritium FD-334 SS-4]|uniref:Cupredoxin n=1 Tax=Hypholoma sublateritium (strain FD-334 SS-4) TaxID=945553 RepID=A0A0D2P777_HYPSF|nr:hypothetical protein HYPSUDRAFT_47543 [Hypholoma sublateritium FD-334 SS-4]